MSSPALPQAVSALISRLTELDRSHPSRFPGDTQALAKQFELSEGSLEQGLEGLVDSLVASARRTPSVAGRRFFSLLFGGRNEAAVVGEIAATLINATMHTHKAGGLQVAIEAEVLRVLSSRAGFPPEGGTFCPGGSLSNQCAITLAIENRFPGASVDGLREIPAVGIYTSADAHYSIPKAAGLVGLGRSCIRKVDVDGRGRMKVEHLAQLIEADRDDGVVPLMVNATAGTTVRGAFDSLIGIADVIADLGGQAPWLHVDGAFGGSLLLADDQAHRFEGLEKADSLTWDLHKVVGVPVLCSVLFCREPTSLDVFDVKADYLYQRSDLRDPGRRSLQCGRRNDALKLWSAWRVHGRLGLSERIEKCLARAAHLESRLAETPTASLACPRESFTVCFTLEGVDAWELCAELESREIGLVNPAVVQGKRVLRWLSLNEEVTPEEIDRFLVELLAVAEELRAGP